MCHSYLPVRYIMVAISRDWHALVLLALSMVIALPCDCTVTLRHLDTTYVPVTYDGDGTPNFAYNKGAVNRLAFQHTKHHMYVTGERVIHLIDYSSPSDLRRSMHHLSDPNMTYTGVDACGDFVAVSAQRTDDSLEGVVYIIFNDSDIVQTIKVGPQPAMVKFAELSNCKKIIVPLTGEVTLKDGILTDPSGAILIITLTADGKGHETKQLDFTAFDEEWERYVESGIRWPWRGEIDGNDTTTFSQSLEPTYVTVDPGAANIVFVCLPWNNAMARVDINNEKIVELYPTGVVSWKSSAFDPSDKDGGIHLKSYDVHGMYQSVAAKLITVADGDQYLLTADGGRSKSYTQESHGIDWSDNMDGKTLVSEGLVDVSDELMAQLSDDTQLGRLYFSTTDGLDDSGDIKKLYTFGGRSFSIFKTSDDSGMLEMYNSKGALENLTAETHPLTFNALAGEEFKTPQEGMDGQSRFKGPLPGCVESVELETHTGKKKKLLFVGTGNPGMIGIYSLPDDFETEKQVTFESLQFHGGVPYETWGFSWEERTSSDLDITDLKILEASESPTNEILLAVAGRATGTVSLYAVFDDGIDDSLIKGLTTFGIITAIVAVIAVIGVIVGVTRHCIKKHRQRGQPRPVRLDETV